MAVTTAARSPRRQAALRTSIGPVEGLESCVRADWWRDIFNANYLRTDGDVADDREITESEVSAFLQMVGVDTDTPILDLCCGQGRHVLELARRGFRNLCGVDRSHCLISRGKRNAGQQGLDVTLREGDARKLRLPIPGMVLGRPSRADGVAPRARLPGDAPRHPGRV
jgi:D-alanine-D-alanine ligase